MRHGVGNTYRHGGCRCEACREVATAEKREVLARMRAAREQGREIIHGTESSYNNWACRCAECREAHRLAAAAYRRQQP